MGSIPLPALGIQQQQQPDLLSKYGQLLQLRNAQTQGQLMQQEAPLRLQALQLGVQDQQQQQAARQALNQAYSQAVTPDANGKPQFDADKLIAGLRNGPAAYQTQAVMENVLKFQKTNVDLQTAKTDLMGKQNDLIGSAAAAVKAAGYDPTLAHSLFDSLPQTPELQQLRQQIDNPQALKGLVDSVIQNSPKQRELVAAEQTAGARQLTAQTMQANDVAERKQAAANAAQTAKHEAVEEKQGAQRISIEGARLAFDKARQGTQDESAIEAQAQQIANGDVKALSQARQNPFARAVMARAYEINPNLSDELYSTKQDFLSSKGKANAQVQSLNKLSAHLGELQAASENAGFSPVGFTSAGKDLRLAEQLFSKEDVKFLSGTGVGTEGELNGLIEKTHSPIQSVRDSAISTLSKFTADAARQLGDQYERGTRLKFDPNEHFTPTTVQMMQKNGGTSARGADGGLTVTAPNGKTYSFKDQASADAFKKNAGIQ